MTPEQLVTFGNHIRANEDQTVVDALAANNPGLVAEWYNQPTTDFYVFAQSVDTDTVRESLVASETAEDEDHATEPGLNAIQRWHFDLLMKNGSYDPSRRVSRDMLVKIFPSYMSQTRSNVLADATRLALRVEQVLAITLDGPGGGDGSAPSSSAGCTHYGTVSWVEVNQALEGTA